MGLDMGQQFKNDCNGLDQGAMEKGQALIIYKLKKIKTKLKKKAKFQGAFDNIF